MKATWVEPFPWLRLNIKTSRPKDCSGKVRSNPICFGFGGVWENHPTRAWHEELGWQSSAGMACQCNEADGMDQPDVSQVIVDRE
jgi:hypothetical protein